MVVWWLPRKFGLDIDIGNRFKEVIDKIINPSQSAYIKRRYIGENTRLVYDIITHVNESNESGLIMAADFEAAFETVSWPYLRLVLKEMNFGKYFRNIIDIMYLNAQNFFSYITKRVSRRNNTNSQGDKAG